MCTKLYICRFFVILGCLLFLPQNFVCAMEVPEQSKLIKNLVYAVEIGDYDAFVRMVNDVQETGTSIDVTLVGEKILQQVPGCWWMGLLEFGCVGGVAVYGGKYLIEGKKAKTGGIAAVCAIGAFIIEKCRQSCNAEKAVYAKMARQLFNSNMFPFDLYSKKKADF